MIICPSKPKEPYKAVILELSNRAREEVVFTKRFDEKNVLVLSEEGEPLTVDLLRALISKNPVFVVGGPDGTEVTGRKLSLGPYTLNHQIAIIVLLELMFRAKNPNHPYNKH
ncbi:MAG: 23S rRNA (pseudouridine(1915)-N(3))-methyltransferase RlmH [Candidatus Altiarchaeota archaeon]|nr:23S rRNA (pseudouridine(1915)-N(3))-methyltransferase RlmH [Candidatus Altiarchaeota archaeon]